jgi:hypothetical protein
MDDPAALHAILASGAYDIAALQGRTESNEALKHKSLAIELTKTRLSKPETQADDRSIIATCILAGTEVSASGTIVRHQNAGVDK